jgi:hypothetical protein
MAARMVNALTGHAVLAGLVSTEIRAQIFYLIVLLLIITPSLSVSSKNVISKKSGVSIEYDYIPKGYKFYINNNSGKQILNGTIVLRFSVSVGSSMFKDNLKQISVSKIRNKEKKEIYIQKESVGKMNFSYIDYEIKSLNFK